jgi:hypothetical protein
MENRTSARDGPIRRFEQRAMGDYQSMKMGGSLILNVGRETVAACARPLMGPLDHGLFGCRGIGHAFAAGISPILLDRQIGMAGRGRLRVAAILSACTVMPARHAMTNKSAFPSIRPAGYKDLVMD